MVAKKLYLAVAIFGAALFLQAPNASAAEEAKPQEKDPYSYIAKDGDNYTVLARKAVQTYGIRENVKLSLAQIVAAETKLASDAGFPEINVGQVIKFETATVKKVMEDAKKIAGDELAAWQTYVPYVNFDTRQNG